jgi:hypothetical protein
MTTNLEEESHRRPLEEDKITSWAGIVERCRHAIQIPSSTKVKPVLRKDQSLIRFTVTQAQNLDML